MRLYFFYIMMQKVKNDQKLKSRGSAMKMGLVRITSWYPNFNGSHFGLPPSEIHRMTGLPPKIVWNMTYSHRPHSFSLIVLNWVECVAATAKRPIGLERITVQKRTFLPFLGSYLAWLFLSVPFSVVTHDCDKFTAALNEIAPRVTHHQEAQISLSMDVTRASSQNTFAKKFIQKCSS